MRKEVVVLAVIALAASLTASCGKGKECECKRYNADGDFVGNRFYNVSASKDCKKFSEEITDKNPERIVCE